MKLAVCSSSIEDLDKKYINDCNTYLDDLFKEDNDLVYGAYDKGLMNISYQKALKYNRNIIGITPKIFEADAKDIECNKIITDNISNRTVQLIEHADALIFLPGGIGTIYELFTSIELIRSKEYTKPIIIYNCNGYFDKLLAFLDTMYEEKFANISIKEYYHISANSTDTINYLNKYFKERKNK